MVQHPLAVDDFAGGKPAGVGAVEARRMGLEAELFRLSAQREADDHVGESIGGA
jgi:hypothetical protein